jgi:hypothetical protein
VYGSAMEELFKNRPEELVDILIRPIAVAFLGLVMVSCRKPLANLCRSRDRILTPAERRTPIGE